MATFLYRLGRASFIRRKLVLGVWIVVFLASALAAATLSGPTSTSFSIPGTESQEAIDMLQERFPAMSASGATANIVFRAAEGGTLQDPASSEAVADVMGMLREGPQVAFASDPLAPGSISPDGTTAFSRATYAVSSIDLSEADREELLAVAEAGREAGLTVEIGGDVFQQVPEQGAGEMIGFAIAAVVLFITFGSIVAAGLPLLTAIVGIGIGLSLITAATGFVEIGATTSILALMIGLGVSIDYALFIVSRHRTEYTDHPDIDLQEAAGRAVGTAGSAVVFAGLTVIIALTGLAVVGIPLLTEMGLAAVVTVSFAVLIALTLLPALLGFAGIRVMGRNFDRQHEVEVEAQHEQGWLRWAGALARRPLPIMLAAIGILVLLSVPVLDLRLGLPDDGTASPSTTQRKAYDLLAGAFGAGFNGPLTIVVDAEGAPDPAAATQAVATTIETLDGVVVVTPPTFNERGDTAVLSVIPMGAPSSAATNQLVADIRSEAEAIGAGGGPAVAVTGVTALTIDVSQKLGDALLPYLLIVVGLALLLLMLVFRSILVPVTATLGFVLTLGATFGMLVAVFQWGWFSELIGAGEPGPIMSMLPIFLIGVVFGLAMDYQYFLVTRMREEHVHGLDATKAVVVGFGHGARVVTAAAIVMIGVFGGFVISPEPLVKSIGLAFAFAVFFDAFIVRMTIIPTAMVLMGEKAWWLPKWLDKILPDVDIEGAKLEHRLNGNGAGSSAAS
jgi:RND superfamily putative drug exporter